MTDTLERTAEGTKPAGGARSNPDIVILGSGFAGLCTAIQLKRAGITNFVILEKEGDLGGTWRDNTYPGSGCDVPSHLYSFSFEPEWDWSRKFGPHNEIHDYMEHCADKYGLRPHIRFNTEVDRAEFDEKAGTWTTHTKTGETYTSRVLVSGVGQLNRPFTPHLEGIENFKGDSFHSARWNHDVDLDGKTVAVIGNGASAIQFVPEIAPKVKQLYIYQRSPNWVVPKPDRPYKDWERKLYRDVPLLVKLHRFFLYLRHERNFLAFRKGSWFGKLFEKAAIKEMETHIKDPELRRILTPDYPAGCKRILLSNDWFPTMARDNVEVVTSHVDHVTEGAIVSEDGKEREIDVIIYATGFEATKFLTPMEIVGRNGRRLHDVWKEGALAYYGIVTAGFPNFFMLYGPNTNLGHNSIIHIIECQVTFILHCIKALFDRHLTYLDVREDAQARFNEELDEELKKSVWDAECGSWYKTETGKVTNNWSSFSTKYWWQTLQPDFRDFDQVVRPHHHAEPLPQAAE